MATPVVTVASGGLPVVDVTATAPKMGLPVTEALAGRGIAVTKVAGGGMPVTYSTIADYPGGGGSEAAAFLARTSGLDAPHTAAYTALINGLVAYGVWAKLDVLHIYATQNTATAQLNLVSTSYPATLNGSPAFVADRGYTGAVGSTVYISTGFNQATAASPKFTLPSGHISAWNLTEQTLFKSIMGNTNPGDTMSTMIIPKATDNNFYFRVNSSNSGSDRTANATAVGHYVASRTAEPGPTTAYRNGSSVGSNNYGTFGLANNNMYVLAFNNNGTSDGSTWQTAMASIGGGLTPTDVGNFYTGLRAYMTAVGVP